MPPDGQSRAARSRPPYAPHSLAKLALAAGLALAACSPPRITVELDTPSGSNLLAGVVKLRLTVSGPDFNPRKAEADRSAPELVVPEVPLGKDRVIRVDGFDSSDKLRATGRSAPFEMTGDSPRSVKVTLSGCIDSDGDGIKNCNGDCNDHDPLVKPGQTKYFTQASNGSFDYNCDDTAQRELTAVASCTFSKGSCSGDGWQGSVPACGATHSYVTCARGSGAGSSKCVEQTTTKQQACR